MSELTALCHVLRREDAASDVLWAAYGFREIDDRDWLMQLRERQSRFVVRISNDVIQANERENG